MIKQKKFTAVYKTYNAQDNIELLFHDPKTKTALLFDGADFIFQSDVNSIPLGFEPLDGISTDLLEIDSVRQSDDVTLIKFTNGNIFQINDMLEGNGELLQVLSIFEEAKHSKITTPLGVSVYEAAHLRYNAAEECDILNS